MLKVGQAAPMFVLPDADMEDIDIAQFRGNKNVILFFYPRDDTPACTLDSGHVLVELGLADWTRDTAGPMRSA